MLVHLVTKLGTAANDAATSLKLLEKGLKKEDLALAVLIDFPFQILFGYLAAKWSKGDKPLKPASLSPSPRGAPSGPGRAIQTWPLTSETRPPAVADRHVDSTRLGRSINVAHRALPGRRHRHVVLLPRRRVHRRFQFLLVRFPSLCLGPSFSLVSTKLSEGRVCACAHISGSFLVAAQNRAICRDLGVPHPDC